LAQGYVVSLHCTLHPMAQPAGSGRTPAAILAEAEVLNWLAATVRRLDRLLSKFAQTTREPLLLEPLLPLPRQDTFHWNVLADAFVPPAPDLPHPPAADLLDPPHDLLREPAEVPGRAEASPHNLPCEVAGGSTTTGGCTGGGCRTGGCIAGGDRATGGFTTGGCTGGHTGGGDTGSNHSTGGFTGGSNAGGDYTTGGFTTGGCAGGHTGGGNTGDNHSTGSNTDGDYTNGFLPSSGGNGASPFDLEQGGSNDPGVAAAVGSFFGPGGGGGKGTFAEELAELSLDTEKHPEQSYDTGAVKRTEKIPDTEKHTEQENAKPKKKAVAKRRKKKKQENGKKEHNNDSNNDDTNSHSHSHSNTNDQQPTINNQQPTTNNQQPTNYQQPATNNQLPTTNCRPATNNQQPTTNNQQPTTYNLQPTANNQQPTLSNHQEGNRGVEQGRGATRTGGVLLRSDPGGRGISPAPGQHRGRHVLLAPSRSGAPGQEEGLGRGRGSVRRCAGKNWVGGDQQVLDESGLR